jgi:predicted HTH transcriptional regulator
MKCDRCGREISKDESFAYQGQTLCEDDYMDVMSSQEKTCDPWATYLSTKARESAGQKGEEGLTDMEKKIYEFVKGKGRATRQEVIAEFGLSAEDLNSQLHVLMHSELIKEHSQGGTMYLIPIPVG